MNEIYVVGHRNPDTDSIVAAMSYAALRNALGDRDYVAAYLGHVSDETQRLLNRFGFQPPQLIQNVRTQVSDLDYDTPPALNATVTMDRAWHIMREQRISAIPVVNEDGTLYGTLSAGDIATYSMNTISEPRVEALPLFNLLSVIEGRVLNDTGDLVDSVLDHVQTAVTYIGHIGILIYNSRHYHSGSHAPEVLVFLRTVSDLRICSFYRMTNNLHRIVIRIFTDFIHKDPYCM